MEGSSPLGKGEVGKSEEAWRYGGESHLDQECARKARPDEKELGSVLDELRRHHTLQPCIHEGKRGVDRLLEVPALPLHLQRVARDLRLQAVRDHDEAAVFQQADARGIHQLNVIARGVWGAYYATIPVRSWSAISVGTQE